ncbi:MAG TPA: acetyl-CoA hydrolase/transferase C-terminal domain-containing protein [Spirochaetota bacterium]|nr:acetyl-CoA hydrolase/transferase C-terminal domain-containing protein [Spirochaetota bacterium]
MNGVKGVISSDVEKTVDKVLRHVGKEINFTMTLGLGKPVLFINELYRRAKEDPEIKLKIMTALALEKPKGNTELEKRFSRPLAERIFAGTPEFDYMLDFRAGTLPENVEIFEFFNKAGGYMNNPIAQQNHLNSNYTHIARDAFSQGANVFGQLIGCREINGKMMYSMGSNTDICIEAAEKVEYGRSIGKKMAIIAEVNENMPFMYGDALCEAGSFDILLTGPQYNYPLFAPPKDAVSMKDYMIGINVSTLIKDGGTIQVGIGSLGDAIVASLDMRHSRNELYKSVIENAGLLRKYGTLIRDYGGTDIFKQGLYGSSEMFVDAFMQLYKRGILKRKVFDNIPVMKLINEGKLDPENIPSDILELIHDKEGIHLKLRAKDFDMLTEFGILKDGLTYRDGFISDGNTEYSADLNDKNNLAEIKKLLGKKLKKGQVILGAFFLGPKSFYDALNEMSEDERSLFGMSGVEKVNQLYGGEELRALQRKDGRFVNSGMIANILGAITSDQLEDGRVVSGIGGQYNFVSMAHALPDARLIMMIRSTRGSGKNLSSNIVFSYGHCSIPKHLRDIIVTEYGIADVRGKPDKDIIAEMINISDSRFQQQLVRQAKKSGKLPDNYEIPEEYRNNTPQKIEAFIRPYQAQGHFKQFPYGTDLLPEEIALGASLKMFKNFQTEYPVKTARGLFFEMFRSVPEKAVPYLKIMELDKPVNLHEKFLRNVVLLALRKTNKI